MKKKVGITTTIPIEPFYAANWEVHDLNNRFIIEQELNANLPDTICTWVRGCYHSLNNWDLTVVVINGDCSHHKAVFDLYKEKYPLHGFSYPNKPDANSIDYSIKRIEELLDVSRGATNREFKRLIKIRKIILKFHEVGTASYSDFWPFYIGVSDFQSNPEKFIKDFEELKENCESLEDEKFTVAILGVPPIFTDLYKFIEDSGGRIRFQEFAYDQLTIAGGVIAEAYSKFMYPYDVQHRWKKMQSLVKQTDAVILYTQTFCHHPIDALYIRDKVKELALPFLQIEGDKAFSLDPRTKNRLEAFLWNLR